MTAAEIIREEIRRQTGEFTSDVIWCAVKHAIQHLKWPNGAVIKELWSAHRRGEIVKVGVSRTGQAIVNTWRRAADAERELRNG